MLFFIFAGLGTRWKQVVAYYSTPNSVAGAVFKPIILEIITNATKIGLNVVSVTSDMGPSNQAMCRAFGVVVNKFCRPVNKISHPSNDNRHLYFLADVPHLVKNLKASLINNGVFKLHPDTVKKYNLPSDTVTTRPIRKLISYQQKKGLKIAPQLSENALETNHFNKMKVSHALNFFGHSVSAALKFMVNSSKDSNSDLRDLYVEGEYVEFERAAWFFEQVNKWFDLIFGRHPVMVLSKTKLENYEAALQFLNEFIVIIESMSVGRGQ